jgi:hypothetical protein
MFVALKILHLPLVGLVVLEVSSAPDADTNWFLAHLVSMSANSLHLETYNPQRVFEVPRASVAGMRHVMTTSDLAGFLGRDLSGAELFHNHDAPLRRGVLLGVSDAQREWRTDPPNLWVGSGRRRCLVWLGPALSFDPVGNLDQVQGNGSERHRVAIAANNGAAIRQDRQHDVLGLLEAVLSELLAQQVVGVFEGGLDRGNG